MISRYFVSILICCSIHQCEKIVRTSYGKLNGKTTHQEDGNHYYSFKSVPFAQPPVGNLRFELPQKPKSWNHVRNATEYSAACLSPEDLIKKKVRMDEDCLYLNIFTSEKCLNSASCDVIVYYHGGGGDTGSAVGFPDDFILNRYVKEDIVFVIPAYRLGVLGLYNLQDENITHNNLFFHDCVFSLHYIHDEISNFGGDPDKVNKMGHSSGATIVSLMGLSSFIDPTQKLFKRVMSFSMAPVFAMPDLLSENVHILTERLGCHTSSDKRKSLDCMKNIDYTQLMEKQYQMSTEQHNFMYLLKGEPFMESNGSIETFLDNCVPREFLIGVTQAETGTSRWRKPNPAISGNFWDFENPFEVAKYFDYIQEASNFTIPAPLSQAIFVSSAVYSKKLVERGGKVFLFQSDQQPNSSHTSDLQYIIGTKKENQRPHDKDILDSFYSQMLVNFTKFGNPSPNWKQLEPAKMNYFSLQVDSATNTWPAMKNGFHQEDVHFWMHNMTVFDKLVTKSKKLRTHFKSEEFEISPISDQWWLYLSIVGVSFLVATSIFFVKRSLRRHGYISLE